jgi:hypothetical protein
VKKDQQDGGKSDDDGGKATDQDVANIMTRDALPRGDRGSKTPPKSAIFCMNDASARSLFV